MSELTVDFALMIGGLVAIVLLIVWLSSRAKKRKTQRHLNDLQAIASQNNGMVTTADGQTAPWSAGLREAFDGRDHAGLANTLRTHSPPRYDCALTLQRGAWHVRVVEASYETGSNSPHGGTNTLREYTIDVAIQPTPALKFAPIMTHDFGEFAGFVKAGKERSPENRLVDPPVTVRNQGAPWGKVQVPTSHSHHFVAYAADERFSAAVLTEESLSWLTQHHGLLRDPMTIEGGFLYMARSERLDPQQLLPRIDLILGFLERAPVQPRDPRTATRY